jgi:EAL domain-containing protein (putative c-di-GMP-specific phosphodiesterase class I)/GGDEF domain-containing protein
LKITKVPKAEVKGTENMQQEGTELTRAELEHKLFLLTSVDQMTGLDRKDYFAYRTRAMLDAHPELEFVLVYWNVNRFRVINDVFSADTGDRVLVNISAKLKALTATLGTAGRLNDDKFIFCVASKQLRKKWLLENANITLISDTAAFTFKSTFGIYEITDRSIPVDLMMDRARLAQQSVAEFSLVQGNPYAYYDQNMRRQMLEDQYLLSQMNYALEEGQFKIYLQPVYDLSTGRVVSSEALVRWLHPTQGLIPPGKFISVFEKNGMISQLDRYIWNQAAAEIEKRLSAGLPCVPISINVSRVDFFTTTLLEELDEIVTSHHLPENMLRVEVTESAYTDDPDRIITMVREMRLKGFRVLLDDFGSGYSSFNTLKDMPIDILKIDMKFLEGFESSDKAGCILESIVEMAKKMHLDVIAEGVETEAQARFLFKTGCRKVQGFLYSRPVPVEEFYKLLIGPAKLALAEVNQK